MSQKQNLAAIFIAFVGFINLANHAECPGTAHPSPVNCVYNFKGSLVILAVHQIIDFIQFCPILVFIHFIHLCTFIDLYISFKYVFLLNILA